ncbi:hypothetical protein QVA99_12395 [Clostridioides difficile]|uniref:DUF7666 domain-containing protein n=1 Tax=Clostridioides difficile TaxID=1496 RepID=UPI0025AABD08|nr:hypothetical protein [Clostridioides difficile]MDI6119101.1 hypothetical protein [Clostridioides difficile]MDM9959274.1 hypothetical protein [Clostridioides difficile]
MLNLFNTKYGKNVKITEKEAPTPPPKQSISNRLDAERLRIELEKEKKKSEEDEWVWVEGYKGTDENMKCRDFQYELNKTYSMNGEDVGACNCGFHLCLDLEDVFGYYDLNLSNRFFKVKALVKKADKNKYGELSRPPSGFSGICRINKIVAKEIIFLKEVTFDELKVHIRRIFPGINTKFEWYALRKLGVEEYYHRMFMNQMKKIRFSDTFSQLLFDKCFNHYEISEILNKAIAYSKENLSKDMLVYLLMKDIRKQYIKRR